MGIEQLSTGNGLGTQPFVALWGERIWTANGLIVPTTPFFEPITNIWAPFGSTTSYINVTSGGVNVPDYFVCSKNIRVLRFYTQFQTSVSSTSRWRTRLYLNGVNTISVWGAPPNNIGNMRVFGVLEYGGIAAGTQISVRIENNTLPVSIQNQNSYFVVEYEI